MNYLSLSASFSRDLIVSKNVSRARVEKGNTPHPEFLGKRLDQEPFVRAEGVVAQRGQTRRPNCDLRLLHARNLPTGELESFGC